MWHMHYSDTGLNVETGIQEVVLGCITEHINHYLIHHRFTTLSGDLHIPTLSKQLWQSSSPCMGSVNSAGLNTMLWQQNCQLGLFALLMYIMMYAGQ